MTTTLYCVYLNHNDGFGYILDGMFDSYIEAKNSLSNASIDGYIIKNSNTIVVSDSDISKEDQGYFELELDKDIPMDVWDNTYYSYAEAREVADQLEKRFGCKAVIHYITETDVED